MTRFSAISLLGLAILAVFGPSGCQKGAVIHQHNGPDTTSPTTQPTIARAQIDLLLPKKIDILPFTKPVSFDDDAIPDGIEVVLRPLDTFGDQTKAVGLFRFELYQAKKASADPRGERLGIWEVDLNSIESQKKHWDRITRTYHFKLGWAGERVKAGRYVLEVTHMSPWGKRLNATYIIQAAPPRGLIKEQIEKKRNQ